MKLLRLQKDNGFYTWVQMSEIVCFQEAGTDLLIMTTNGMGYRLTRPDKVLTDFINKSVVMTCKACVE